MKKRAAAKRQLFGSLSFGFHRINADGTAILTPSFESNLTGYFCIDGVVLAHANVLTHVETGAALTDDDGAGSYQLTVMGFGSHALCVGITAVVGRTGPFLMSV